jgi:hypothetical protein
MSDAISKAIEAMDMARSAVGPFGVVVTKKLTNAIEALQALQSGEPVGYIVRIDGDYKFYESYEDAKDDRASEEYWYKDLDHAEPEPVYTTPQPVIAGKGGE